MQVCRTRAGAILHVCTMAGREVYPHAQHQRCTCAVDESPAILHSCIYAVVHNRTTERMQACMKIVAVTINKGGAGKTMIARSLGTLAAEAGLTVLILDMDTQQNSTSWRRRRPTEVVLPLVQFTTENDLEETLSGRLIAECDLVIIDTPPGRSTEAPAAVEAADLVLIPCTPDVECFEGLPRTARLARTTGKTAVVVPNSLQPNSRAEEDAVREVAGGAGAADGAGRLASLQRAPRRQPARQDRSGAAAGQPGCGRA